MSQSVLLVLSVLALCSTAIPVPQFGMPGLWQPPGGFPFGNPFNFVFNNQMPQFPNMNQIPGQNGVGVGSGVIAISGTNGGGGFVSTINGQGQGSDHHQIFVISTQHNGEKPHTQVFGNVNGQEIHKEV